MKKINNAFAIALQYAEKIDLSGITLDNIDKWCYDHEAEVKTAVKDYMADPRLNWRITNEHFYASTFEEAMKHLIEKKLGATESAWELAKKLVVQNPQYPHEVPETVSIYPEKLMDEYREILDNQPTQFKWNSADNNDALWKGTFMSAWHDGEKIPPPKIFGIRQDLVLGTLALLTLYVLLRD